MQGITNPRYEVRLWQSQDVVWDANADLLQPSAQFANAENRPILQVGRASDYCVDRRDIDEAWDLDHPGAERHICYSGVLGYSKGASSTLDHSLKLT